LDFAAGDSTIDDSAVTPTRNERVGSPVAGPINTLANITNHEINDFDMFAAVMN